MRNNNISSSSKVAGNAPFILIIALFIIVFIVVSYFLVSGSAFGNYYVDDLDSSNGSSSHANSSSNFSPTGASSGGGSRNGSTSGSGTIEEVFNIRDNEFTYDEAKAVCAAHGARLATIEDMIAAYDRGANWCSYGWTQGQLAMYPTQKEYWAKLQMDKDRRNECGEPGLNGGFFENPEFKFGANCYGRKPEPKSNEVERDSIGRRRSNPYTDLIDRYKEGINGFRISPFNDENWSDC